MKKQNFMHFVGIDVSKNSFDVAILSSLTGSDLESFVFNNDLKGTNAFIRLLKNREIDFNQIFCCMEHTGVYGKLIIARLLEHQISFCVEMSLKIMRSTAVKRGKSDKLDAIRIAKYAYKNHEELQLYNPGRQILDKVRLLLSLRDKLITFKIDLNKHHNELSVFDPELFKTTSKPIKKITQFIILQIKEVENELHDLIASDEALRTNIELATSVPGIGKITALYMAFFTNMFTKYNTPKQLACYCGVAPFEHSSGTSVFKRPRVHHMANKTLKKHLHMGALSAIQNDKNLKAYFDRKTEEGKNKMLVLNNVRNKIIQRLCAVMQRQTPYLKNYG